MSRLDELDLSSGTKTEASVELPNSHAATARSGGWAAEDPLAGAKTLAADDSPAARELEDLPLGPAAAESSPSRLRASTAAAAPGPPEGAAPLSARGAAFAADAALVLLLSAAALLAATAGKGQALRLEGLAWTAAFALYLSFFSTVVALILFGKTVGMALTGLTARGRTGSPLTAAEAARRWLGTLLTLASVGVALIATRRDHQAPSPGDRLSGRPLEWELL